MRIRRLLAGSNEQMRGNTSNKRRIDNTIFNRYLMLANNWQK
jgi:hypothetical protein